MILSCEPLFTRFGCSAKKALERNEQCIVLNILALLWIKTVFQLDYCSFFAVGLIIDSIITPKSSALKIYFERSKHTSSLA